MKPQSSYKLAVKQFWTEYTAFIRNSWKKITRAGLILALINFSTLFILGFSFFAITFGASYAVSSFFLYWQPANKAMQWLSGSKEPLFGVFPAPIPAFRWPFFVIRIIIVLYFFYFGVSLLVTQGFCEQNILFC